MNNAFDAKISRPTTIYTSMAGVDIGGAWGRHWFVRKWGETANFILHFSPSLSLEHHSLLISNAWTKLNSANGFFGCRSKWFCREGNNETAFFWIYQTIYSMRIRFKILAAEARLL